MYICNLLIFYQITSTGQSLTNSLAQTQTEHMPREPQNKTQVRKKLDTLNTDRQDWDGEEHEINSSLSTEDETGDGTRSRSRV